MEAHKKPRQTFREGQPQKPPEKPPQGSRKASPSGSPSGRPRGVQPESSTARALAPLPAGAVHILGYHPVRAALTARPEDCLAFFVSESRRPTAQLADLVALARQNGIKPILVKREALEAMGSRHQGLALAAKAKREPSLSELFDLVPATEPALIVFLDHLEDPHNFGALIRSAAAFGALGVVYPKDRSAPLSPAVRLASAGGTEAIALVKVANLARAIGEAKKRGFWAVAAQAGSRTDALDFDYPERTALILGSEGDGLSHVLAANSDMSVGVTLQSSLIDSLNVSNAGAILMHGYRASLARKNKQPVSSRDFVSRFWPFFMA